MPPAWRPLNGPSPGAPPGRTAEARSPVRPALFGGARCGRRFRAARRHRDGSSAGREEPPTQVPKTMTRACCQCDSPLPFGTPVFTHVKSPREPLPQLAGEGGAQRRMGCGQLLRPTSDCTTVTANLHRSRPRFPHPIRPHSPSKDGRLSTPYGATFPASRKRGTRRPMRRPGRETRRVNVDFPGWVLAALDREAQRLGVTRQALIKLWIAGRLDRTAWARRPHEPI